MKTEPSMIAYLLLEREETALATLDGMERALQFNRIVRMCAEAEVEEGKSQAVMQLHKLARRLINFKIGEFKNAVEVEIAKIREPVRNGNGQKPQLTEKEEAIVQELGAPFHRTPTSYVINTPYFARLWGTNRLAFYDQASETFYHYLPDHGLYVPLREDDVRSLIVKDLYAEAAQRGFSSSIGSKLTTPCQRGIIDHIKADRNVCHPNFFKPDNTAPPVIHVANGMVCITKAGIELCKFDPKYKSRNQIPIAYKPGSPCKRFLSELLLPVMSKEDVEMLQRYCGLILIGGNRAQKILFLLGEGGTGKGTIVRLIVRILGSINVEQLRVDQLNGRFETSRLIGKLLLNVVEAPADFFNQPGAEIVKALCGHDVMNAEKKNVNESMSLVGVYPALVTSNEQIRVRLSGDENSWARRILINEFPKPRPPGAKVIDNFDEVLFREEGEGILNWMIEGAEHHWAELVSHKGFASTPAQKKRVDNLIARSKSIEIFVQTEIRKSPDDNVTVSELYDGYTRFCNDRGWTAEREQTFEEKSRGFIIHHWGVLKSNDIERNKKDKRGYRGLTTHPPGNSGPSPSESEGNPPEPSEDAEPPFDDSGTREIAPNTEALASPEVEQDAEPTSSPIASYLVPPIPPSTPAAGFCVATNPERIVGIDTETFYPWPSETEITKQERDRKKAGKAHVLAVDSRRNALRLLTVATSDSVRTFDMCRESIPAAIRELLRTSTLAMHNADFDMSVLRRHGFELSDSIFDTRLASQLLSNGKTTSANGSEEEETDDQEYDDSPQKFLENDLGSVVHRHLGITLAKVFGDNDWSVPSLSSEQLNYVKEDAAHLLPLVARLTEELQSVELAPGQKQTLWECFQTRSISALHINDIKFAGMPIAREAWTEERQKAATAQEASLSWVREIFNDCAFLLPMSRRRKGKLIKTRAADGTITSTREEVPPEFEPINPNNSAHCLEALSRHGIVVKDTKKPTLYRLGLPETDALLKYREQAALVRMFDGATKNTFPDDRVRSSDYGIVRTGRIQFHDPNQQNFHRDYRSGFIAPEPYLWLKADLSQIEMVALAIHCQDQNLIKLLGAGKDVYTEIAAKIFGKEPVRGPGENQVNELLRNTAKIVVLGVSYGMTPYGLVPMIYYKTGLKYTLEDAKRFLAVFFAMFPAIRANQERAEAAALSSECAYTAGGQRRFLPLQQNDSNEYGYSPSLATRKKVLINNPIQGGCSDVFVGAINKFIPRLPAGVTTINLVHDEANFLVTRDNAYQTLEIVTRAFEEAFSELFGNQLKAKLEAKLGPSWADGEPLEQK